MGNFFLEYFYIFLSLLHLRVAIRKEEVETDRISIRKAVAMMRRIFRVFAP